MSRVASISRCNWTCRPAPLLDTAGFAGRLREHPGTPVLLQISGHDQMLVHVVSRSTGVDRPRVRWPLCTVASPRLLPVHSRMFARNSDLSTAWTHQPPVRCQPVRRTF